jgi:hypothetical protein
MKIEESGLSGANNLALLASHLQQVTPEEALAVDLYRFCKGHLLLLTIDARNAPKGEGERCWNYTALLKASGVCRK